MSSAPLSKNSNYPSGYHLIRVLIASYFLMVSFGFISGTTALPVAMLVLPVATAELVGNAALFVLGFLVLTGIWLRPAVILLCGAIFSSSLISHFGAVGSAPAGDFWRDLTLVGTLLLTCLRAPISNRGSLLGLGSHSAPEHNSSAIIMPRRVAVARPSNVTRLPVPSKRTAVFRRVDNIFLDDHNDSLAS